VFTQASTPVPAQVVLSYIYVSLSLSACTLAAGCLLYVKSAHDGVRESSAALLLHMGKEISRQVGCLVSVRGCVECGFGEATLRSYLCTHMPSKLVGTCLVPLGHMHTLPQLILQGSARLGLTTPSTGAGSCAPSLQTVQ